MDAASGAAVLALDVSPGDHVLDLCAAPGLCFFHSVVVLLNPADLNSILSLCVALV